MARRKPEERPSPDEMSYEDAIAELESINRRIEEGSVGLEESLAEYRRGVALARRCSAILENAEQELTKIKPGEEPKGGDDKQPLPPK